MPESASVSIGTSVGRAVLAVESFDRGDCPFLEVSIICEGRVQTISVDLLRGQTKDEGPEWETVDAERVATPAASSSAVPAAPSAAPPAPARATRSQRPVPPSFADGSEVGSVQNINTLTVLTNEAKIPRARIQEAFNIGISDGTAVRNVFRGLPYELCAASFESLGRPRVWALLHSPFLAADKVPFWTWRAGRYHSVATKLGTASSGLAQGTVGRAFQSQTEVRAYFAGAGAVELPREL